MKFAEDPRFIPPAERLDDAGPLAEVELSSGRPPVFVDHSFAHLEIRLGDNSTEKRLEVVSGLEWPQVQARFIVVQPEVLAEDPRHGWVPVGGIYPDSVLIGPGEVGQFSLPTAVGYNDHLLACGYETFLSLTAGGSMRGTLRVAVGDLLTAVEAAARPRTQLAA